MQVAKVALPTAGVPTAYPPGLHLWQLQLAELTQAELGEAKALLSDEERLRAARFHHKLDEVRFVMTRATLRVLLGQALALSPTAVAIGYNTFGKPQLADAGSLKFNVSHSGDVALIALANGAAIGVDVEQRRDGISAQALLDQIASANERAALSVLPNPDRTPALLRLWTLKEALLKAQGLGLQRDPRTIDLTAGLGLAERPFIFVDSVSLSRWRLWAFNLSGAYSAALALADISF
jgi:4'-phosphopantetheinyl transferase